MLDVLDTLIVRDFVASLPSRERTLARLLMAGHTQTSAARELGLTARTVRSSVALLRRRIAA